MTASSRQARLPLLVLALVGLLAALGAGLLRLGWAWPRLRFFPPGLHGPLMVSGFLGTLISLERAVAVERLWAYAAPLLTGLGALLLIVGAPVTAGAALMALGSLTLTAVFIVIVRTQPALFTAVIGLGAVFWAVGNLLWLFGQPIPQTVWWWAGFLVLTIAGERLELSRLLRLSRHVQVLFGGIIGILLLGTVWATVDYAAATRVVGVGLLGLAGWLWRYDIARRRLKAGGQARFIAVCLLSGYLWLAVSGLLVLLHGGVMAGPAYDAMLHALFLGFVFAMIFAHAPIIFPAVLGLPMYYADRFYVHWLLLHATLLLRIGGDLLAWPPGRLWGGLLNAAVLLLFLANTVTAIRVR